MALNRSEIKIPSRSVVSYLTLLPRLLLGFARLLLPSAAVGWGLNPAPVEQPGMAELLAHIPTILIFLLALAAAARTLHQGRLKQSGSNVLVEFLGCTLGMTCVAWAWSVIRSSMPKEHSSLIEDLVDMTVDMAMIHSAEATRALRTQAKSFRRLAEMEAGSGSSGFAKAKHIGLEALMHFLAGAVDGALDGMMNRPRW
jgi:hypothetical protein